MVMNTYNRLTGNIDFDIPGGKRRLGESSFDCAIRETEEETSLVLTRDILNNATVTVYPGKTEDEKVNVYYFINADNV